MIRVGVVGSLFGSLLGFLSSFGRSFLGVRRGFLPLFEIYIAIPAGLAAGLDPFDAATCGAWIHGRAGDRLVTEYGTFHDMDGLRFSNPKATL